MLPNEILVSICWWLEADTLVRVARTSRRLNGVAEYVLYSAVVVGDVLSDGEQVPLRTVGWVESMLGRGHLAESVRRVTIRWSGETCTPLLLAICDQLSVALRTLTRLEHLELFLGPANRASLPRENIHAVERAVFLCSLPALRFCSLAAEYRKGIQPYTAHIASFLAHTPALRHLRLQDHHTPLTLSPNALPRLLSFRGPTAAAAALLPARPVCILALVGTDSDVTRENLDRISRSSVQIRSLDLSAISSRPLLLRNVADFLPTLHRLRVRLALRHTLHYALSGVTLLVGLSSVLHAFPDLVYLDLSPTEGGRANPADERVLCTEYSRACPSLRTIIFPSQMLWLLDDEDPHHWLMTSPM